MLKEGNGEKQSSLSKISCKFFSNGLLSFLAISKSFFSYLYSIWLLVKKVNKDNGEISDGQNTIIDYFTKEQLGILDDINKIESIGGIN